MNKSIKIKNTTDNVEITIPLIEFNTLLEAEQYILKCFREIEHEHILLNGTTLSTNMFRHKVTEILTQYKITGFISYQGGYYINRQQYNPVTETSTPRYYIYKKNDDLESEFFNTSDTYTIEDNTFNLQLNYFGLSGTFCAFPYLSNTTGINSVAFKIIDGFNSDVTRYFPCAGTAGFVILKLPCIYKDTSNNTYFTILNFRMRQSPSNNISRWDPSAFSITHYSFLINNFEVEQPTISGDVTADIDTETGASETQDSEENVGGDGHVTLINNVVNYDNYSPNYSRLNTGFITAYEISQSELVTLHSFLYSETITDMIKNFFAGDASKAIIDLFNIPVAPNIEAASSVINIGVISSGASANVIQGETVTFDFGSIDITANSYYSNSFMDLSPYNQYSIYLPYIGFRNLSTNDVRSINDNGFKIYLKYVVDVLTGDFVAIVEADHNNCAVDNNTGTVTTAKLTKQLINVYNGSMRTDIPLSYRNPLQGLMPIMSGLASTMFTMATASASGATDMQQLSRGADAGMSILNNIGSVNNSLMARSDSISGSVGNLSLRKAFIINQECPKYIRTGKSNQFSGYPVYKFMQLNDGRGYVKVRNVIASNFPGTAHEQEMVVSLLKKGVWCK